MKKLIVVLCLILVVVALYFYGVTTLVIGKLRLALYRAESVRLEVFDESGVIAKRELSMSERASVAAAFPFVIQAPELMTKMCFIPHHRIIFSSDKGGEQSVLICYSCDMYSVFGASPRDFPAEWIGSTHDLFEGFGISTKSPETNSFRPEVRQK